MNIAFCINEPGLRGLGVSLASLVENCSNPGRLKIWFLCSGLKNRTKNKIREYLEAGDKKIDHVFIDFDPEEHFGAYASLHGDRTTYGRLLLADIVKGNSVLYLDADLVVEIDVLELEHFQFGGNFLAAVGGGIFKNTLGNKFYIGKLKIDPLEEYFNAGILLFDLKKWREEKVKDQCLELANKYPLELPSHDQSLLNILCQGKFAKLPNNFNCSWEADQSKPGLSDKQILHFVGAPKPWDPLASILHRGFKSWKKYHQKESNFSAGRFTFFELKRLWHLRRSYARCILNHFKNLSHKEDFRTVRRINEKI